MKAPSVNLIVLRCADLSAAAAFYRALGLALAPEKHGDGPDHFSCTMGGVVLELYPMGRQAGTSGLRLGLVVSDVDAAVAAVAAAKLGQVLAFSENEPTSALLQDPDGHKIQLAALA